MKPTMRRHKSLAIAALSRSRSRPGNHMTKPSNPASSIGDRVSGEVSRVHPAGHANAKTGRR